MRSDGERTGRRLADAAHRFRPWRIHRLTHDFRLEDVWELPTPGGPGDLPLVAEQLISTLASTGDSGAARAVWSARRKLGSWFGWDEHDPDAGPPAASIRDRLPADLRAAPTGPDFGGPPFAPVYLLEDEWAAEAANRMVHAVMHIGWVADEDGGYRGQMAVLVKPNGIPGALYMAAIRPFRRWVVYPALLREIGRDWRARAPERAGPGSRG